MIKIEWDKEPKVDNLELKIYLKSYTEWSWLKMSDYLQQQKNENVYFLKVLLVSRISKEKYEIKVSIHALCWATEHKVPWYPVVNDIFQEVMVLFSPAF